MRVVSLFSGIGGLDQGFIDAGFEIIWSNDFDKYAVDTYKANFKHETICADINKIPLSEIPDFDILIGGFPCQPFSMMGQQKGFEDARGTLFFRIAEIIKEKIDKGKAPKAIILENVKSLKSHDRGRTFQVIRNVLENDLGFKFYSAILNTADYGIPQTRNRTYIICFANHDIDYKFPKPIPLTLTLQDLLEKNVPQKYFLSDKIIPTILSNGTGGYNAKSETDLKIARPLCATMAKMHRACQDNYVTQNGRLRRLTPRECARLQGFNDNFVIPVSDSQAYKQFGNAVTVDVAREVANSVKTALINSGEWKISKQSKSISTNKISVDKSPFRIDRNEIIQFINAFLNEKDDSWETCFKRITETRINDEFLISRASYLQKIISEDLELQESLKMLNIYCKDTKEVCEGCPVRKYCNTNIKNIRSAIPNDALKMVDLFCGAGGLSLGFNQEGFVTVLANDIEPCCIDTYAHNHLETPRKRIVLDDINNIAKNFEEYDIGSNIDIVVGGPPCQGFSMANRQRLIDDPRNHLYKSFVEMVSKIQPVFFVMENVKGMLPVAQQVVEDFAKINYKTKFHVLNAKDYGVPQHRERLIYIGNRIGVDNEKVFEKIFELSRALPGFVLKDALFALRPLKASRYKNSTELGSEESGHVIEKNKIRERNAYIDMINRGREIDIVCNHKARFNNDRDIEIFGRLNPGDRSDDPKIADIMPYARRNDIFKDKYFKLEATKVCKTITAHMKFDCNMYIHPKQARGLTPREAARVQSFPDDYYFRGAYTKTYMQIGNSVPPLLGRAIAHAIKNFLRGE